MKQAKQMGLIVLFIVVLLIGCNINYKHNEARYIRHTEKFSKDLEDFGDGVGRWGDNVGEDMEEFGQGMGRWGEEFGEDMAEFGENIGESISDFFN